MDNGLYSYRRYLSGDDSGIIEIIRDYRDGLLLYLCGITEDFSLAEEATEETFFRLAAKKPRFQEKSSFKTWLYTIARNTAIDLLRKRNRVSSEPLESLETIPDDELSLEASYLREERKIMLHRAMQRLSPNYRQVLYLVYFENLSNAEAASVMKKSKRQVENLVSRARKALKTELLLKEGFIDEDLL